VRLELFLGYLPAYDRELLAFQNFAITEDDPTWDRSFGITDQNKRCLKLPFESLPEPPPTLSNALFIGISAILGGRQLGGKLFFGGFEING
jgi:hypothetical protein